jgi:hypothetical protein
MALTKAQAREKFVELRGQMDEVAKVVLESMDGPPQAVVDEASRVAEGNQKKFNEHIAPAARECRSAFDQWEITEATPLQECESFMDAYHRLMHAVEGFDGFTD